MSQIIIHPIYNLANGWDDGSFDLNLLPFELCKGIAIEDVSHLFSKDTFSWVSGELSRGDCETLSSVRYALVRRPGGNIQGPDAPEGESRFEPIEAMMACLRIIRPMRERLGIMRGEINSDGSLNIKRFGLPYNVLSVPDVEKLFSFRTQDALELRAISPVMLKAMEGEYWKIRMAVEFYQLGHFQHLHWKSRVFSRCSAIEAIFSSKRHKGSGVVKQRIGEFLGLDTCIYEPGDIPSYRPQATEVTIGKMLEYIYDVRNCLAHGDKLPDQLFKEILREGVSGELNIIAVVDESVSFIVRKSLRKIFGEDLIEHFKDSDSADKYFNP